MEIIEQDPIIVKEAANPLSHALIWLKSYRDPYKNEITQIRKGVDDAINTLDACLYISAVGEEKQMRSIMEHLKAVKDTFKGLVWVLANNVPRELLKSKGIKPSEEKIDQDKAVPNAAGLSIPEEAQADENDLPQTPPQVSPQMYIGIQSPVELQDAFTQLLARLKVLIDNIDKLQFKIAEAIGPAKAASLLLGKPSNAEKALNHLQAAVHELSVAFLIGRKTPVSGGEIPPEDLIKEILKREFDKDNFNVLRKTYVILNDFYARKLNTFRRRKQEFIRVDRIASGQESDDSSGALLEEVLAPDAEEGKGGQPTKEPAEINAPEEEEADPITAIEKEPDDEKDSPITTSSSLTPKSRIIFSDSFDKIRRDFIIKYAAKPTLLQSLHTSINELGQNLKAPFSSGDKLDRRVRLRKALKEIKKSAINLLVEIRKTAGKKSSEAEEFARWNAIIAAFNLVGETLTSEINGTLAPLLMQSSAELYDAKIKQQKGLPDQRSQEQQRHMSALMEGFQTPLPKIPSMQELTRHVEKGAQWGQRPLQKQFI